MENSIVNRPSTSTSATGFSSCIGQPQSDSSVTTTSTSTGTTSTTIALIESNNEPNSDSGEEPHESTSSYASPRETQTRNILRSGRIPLWLHRTTLVLLALLLPVLDLQWKGFYFLALQFIVWKLLRGLKKNPSPPYLLLTFMVNLGVTEEQIMHSRKIIFALTFLWTDFWIFALSIAFSQRAFCQIGGKALAY